MMATLPNHSPKKTFAARRKFGIRKAAHQLYSFVSVFAVN